MLLSMATAFVLILTESSFAAEPQVHRDLAYTEPADDGRRLDLYVPCRAIRGIAGQDVRRRALGGGAFGRTSRLCVWVVLPVGDFCPGGAVASVDRLSVATVAHPESVRRGRPASANRCQPGGHRFAGSIPAAARCGNPVSRACPWRCAGGIWIHLRTGR